MLPSFDAQPQKLSGAARAGLSSTAQHSSQVNMEWLWGGDDVQEGKAEKPPPLASLPEEQLLASTFEIRTKGLW